MQGARFPDLTGVPVLVTGGASGIGAAVVEGFATQGARVAFIDRLDGTAFAAEVAARTGAAVRALQADLRDVAALRAAADEAAAAHGPVRVLVAAAADDDRHATGDVTPDYWDRSQAINLRHYFFAAQAVLPGMAAAGGGSVVLFSSISYMMGLGDYPSYVAANAGITGLARGLAREWGGRGVRVNAIAPGWVMTERQRRLWVTPETLSAHLARQCLPRELVPEDMVEPVLFLASAASRAVTGQLLAVDGGVVGTG